MGSILSFPILCLANLVCYWAALEEYLGFRIKLNDLPVLINGDDILFKSNEKLYEIWQRIITSVGFKLSIGKNYIHKSILTVNSQCYHYRSGTFTLLPYLNTGMLLGIAKTGPRGEKLCISDLFNKVTICNNPERTGNRFIHYNLKAINFESKNGLLNMFIPKIFGGLGCNRKPLIITRLQQQLAEYRHSIIRELGVQKWYGNQLHQEELSSFSYMDKAMPQPYELGIFPRCWIKDRDVYGPSKSDFTEVDTKTLRIMSHTTENFLPVQIPQFPCLRNFFSTLRQREIPYYKPTVYPNYQLCSTAVLLFK